MSPWPKILGWGAAIAAILLARRARAAPAEPARPPSPAPTIHIGSTGPAVRWWRWRVGLDARGDAFDEPTRAATMSWQAARGLTADGIVGPITWASAGITGAAPSPPSPAPAPLPSPSPLPGPAPLPLPGASDPFGLSENIATREQQIIDHVSAGHVEHEWAPLSWTRNGHTASILISARPVALKIGNDRLFISTTYPTAQKIADMLGGAFATTLMSDELWRQAEVQLAPITRPWSQDGTMARTSRMREQSAAIEAAIGGRAGRVANAGKLWVVTRRNWTPPEGTGVEKPAGTSGSRHNGANFGWYLAGASSMSPGGEHVIQSVGLAHAMGHVDYSQLVTLVRPDSLTIDGAPIALDDALRDPQLSHVVQDEGGAMPRDRHPDL